MGIVILSADAFFWKPSTAPTVHPAMPVVSQITPLAPDVLKKRGISDAMKAKFDENISSNSGKFLSCDDGTKQITPDILNDGFCDCKDGSDEPGTASCTGHVSKSQTFDCINKGYRLMQIPASRVDDSVCDCCDGSDEGHLVQCPDTCNAAAAKEREALTKLINDYKVGSAARMEYINKVKSEKEDKAAPLSYLKSEIERQEASLSALAKEKEAEAKKIQEWEQSLLQEAMVKANNILKLDDLTEAQLGPLLSSLFSILDFTKPQVDKLIEKMRNGDSSNTNSDGNSDNYDENPSHADEAQPDPYASDDSSTDGSDVPPEGENHENESQNATPNDNENNNHEVLSTCPLFVHSKSDQRLSKLCEPSPEHQLHDAKLFLLDFLQANRAYSDIQFVLGYYRVHGHFDGAVDFTKEHRDAKGNENGAVATVDTCPSLFVGLGDDTCTMSSNLIELFASLDKASEREDAPPRTAEEQHKQAEARLKSLESDRDDAQNAFNDLEKHKDHLEYLALKDECFSKQDGKFHYKLCVLNEITQADSPNGYGTSLGSFESIRSGEDGGIVIEFRNGQYCHAFGPRTADVFVSCGAENVLLSASEPSTCYYTFKFESPAACSPAFAESQGILNLL